MHEQDWEWAVKGFTSLLELQDLATDRLSTLANRSAAHLGVSNAAACLQDCNAALTMLLLPSQAFSQGSSDDLTTKLGM